MLRIWKHRLAMAGSAVALVAAIAPPAQAEAPPTSVVLDLPAQPLADALRTVALRTGVDVVAAGGIVAGRQAPGLEGRFTAVEAVQALLAGSGLQVRRVGSSLVVVARVDEPAAVDGAASDPGQIVVTGTNVRGAQPTSKLIVVTRDDIDKSGATSVDQLMRNVPQNTQGGNNKENALVARPDASTTDHGAGLNLRGLGQRATLVLVNGHRLAPSGTGAYVDVSLIPVSALERVEILTDGASAIYGSDAVGGVVNLILRDRYDGAETALQAGATTQGGGELFQLAQTFGREWASGHGLVSYEYRREDEVRAAQRAEPIGLKPDTFLLPRERRHSLLGTVFQDLAPNLRLDLTGTMARRTTARTEIPVVSNLPIYVAARANSYTLAGELEWALAARWHARLGGNYALLKTTQRQDQPQNVSAPLVNARDVRNAIREASLKLDGSLFDLPAGPVSVALGGEIRGERYQDAFRSSFFAPTVKQGARTVRSAYGEVLVPLFGPANRRPGLERLELSAAARYDDYSRTGADLVPKVGARWSPVRGLDLRGSYSASFRAPLLAEAIGAYTVLLAPAQFFYANPALAPAGNLIAVLQGSNPAVQPERSRNWSAGAELKPVAMPGLTLTANYYTIRFSKRIALPAIRANVVGDPAYASIVNLAPSGAGVAALFAGAVSVSDFTGPGFSNGGATAADIDVVLDTRVTNTAVSRTRGFDLGLRYTVSTGASRLALDLNVNHVIAFEEQLVRGGPVIVALDRPYRPLDWRGRAGLSWSRARWSASAFVNYADDYLDDRRPATVPVQAHTTVDLNLAYTIAETDRSPLRGTRIGLYVENLFDNDPPVLVPDPPSTTGIGYDPVNATARGRYVALQLRKSW